MVESHRRDASLAIIGPYPPPRGGVTVHVQRLCHLLDERGVDYRLYNLASSVESDRIVSVADRRRRFFLSHAILGRERGVYVVSPRLVAWAYAATVARVHGKRVAVRIQNNRIADWQRNGDWRARAAGAALRQVSTVVCVNREIAAAVEALGVAPERIACIPGFLPPTAAETDAALVSADVWSFIDGRHPVVVANGKVATYAGADLYGLDHVVEMAGRLRARYPRIAIVVCLYESSPEGERHLERLRDRARDLGVGDCLLFNTSPGPLVPLLRRADLFVRPTNTDGDANSIREALYLGIPTLASDAVARPSDAETFPTRDLDAMVAKADLLLARGRKPAPAAAFARSAVDAYVDLLIELARGRR